MGKIDVTLKNVQKNCKNMQKRGTHVKTRAKTYKNANTYAKTRAKTENGAPKIVLTRVGFGIFFGRPGFTQKFAFLLQPLPRATGAAKKKHF